MVFIDGYNLKKVFPVRAEAELTTSYVAGNIIDVSDANQLILYVKFTKGSLTSAEIKIEFSADNTTFYQERNSIDALKTHSFNADGNYRLVIPVMEKYVKVSAKGTGTVTDSKMQIDALVGTA
ncbi:MAG TPA: hypothetical protein PLC43_04925 [Caldisericia bacterium]|nr:hypothetical protein [Caldisericia bacterium]